MILCAGEALIDMLPRDTPDGAGFLPVPGGSVFNTAIALGRLEEPVAMHTGLSTDMFGQRLAAALAQAGVEDRTACSDRPSTLAFVSLNDGQASYAFYDENTAGRMLSPLDAPDMAGIEALFIGGISLATEPCSRAYEGLALGHAHLPIMIDPNIRPDFIVNENGYRARLGRLLHAADIVKLSDEDLAWLHMTPADVLDHGVDVLCLTEGDRGAVAMTRAGEVRVEARKVEVVDTVGAGDTFNAGFLAGLAGRTRSPRTCPQTRRCALPWNSASRRPRSPSRARGANPPRAEEL